MSNLHLILLFENDRNLGEILQSYFEDVAGWNVISVISPDQIIPTAIAHQPEAMVLDVSPLSSAGVSLLQLLKETPIVKDIPIILLTARTSWLSTQDLATWQIVVAIDKPFDVINGIHLKITTALGWSLN